MVKAFSGLFLLMLWPISGASEVPAESEKSLEQKLEFKVFLNDREVGSHQYHLQQQGERLLVSSTMNLDFTVMLVKKIKYRHQANEVWQGDCLVSLTSQTEKLGKNISVNAVTDAQGLTVSRSHGSGSKDSGNQATETIEGCARGFAYWNPALLEADFLLNAESGEYVPVEITTTQSPTDNLSQMLIDGPQADVLVQYDAAGNWLSLESKLQIGGLIRYRRVAPNPSSKGQ